MVPDLVPAPGLEDVGHLPRKLTGGRGFPILTRTTFCRAAGRAGMGHWDKGLGLRLNPKAQGATPLSKPLNHNDILLLEGTRLVLVSH